MYCCSKALSLSEWTPAFVWCTLLFFYSAVLFLYGVISVPLLSFPLFLMRILLIWDCWHGQLTVDRREGWLSGEGEKRHADKPTAWWVSCPRVTHRDCDVMPLHAPLPAVTGGECTRCPIFGRGCNESATPVSQPDCAFYLVDLHQLTIKQAAEGNARRRQI